MTDAPQPTITTPPARTTLQWLVFLLVVVAAAVGLIVLPRIFAEIRYPLEFDDLIVKEATEHDLDPFLVAAVVYSESHFKPAAASPVGARGLMQLMPQTAAGIARRLGDSGFAIDKLYDPATNLRYGTYHLQGLMGRYNSNVEAALVGYNGGGGAGDRYEAGEREGSVPRESLRYVGKVLAAKSAYEELYPARLNPSKDLQDFLKPATQEPLANVLLRAAAAAVSARVSQ